jgi:RPA family protein
VSNSPGRREVAHRLFAAEFDDADFSYSESDEERAPNYVVTPTGARVNRLFLVGVLTEVEQVNEEMLRARIVDPTGAFVVYAGQYQPDELAFLERVEPPTFLAVTGKARTFEPDDSDRVFTSVRPESINEVDAETRDRWAVNAAERTLERIETMAAALESGLSGDDLRAALVDAGVEESFAAGVPLALDHYGTTPDYLGALREVCLDVARLVADETEEARGLDVAPGEGDGDPSALADPDLVIEAPATEPAAGAESAGAGEPEPDVEADPSETESGEPSSTDAGADGTDVSEPEAAERESSEAEPVEASSGSPGSDAGAAPEPTSETTDVDAEPATDAGATVETTSEATTAPEASTETTPADDGDDIGDFEPGEFDDDAESPEESPEDVLEEDERREIEEEYGTDFSTASEVEEPGEAGGSGSEAEPAEGTAETESEPETAAESEPETEPTPEPDATETEGSERERSAVDEETSGEAADEADVSTDETPDEEAAANVEAAAEEEAAADVEAEDEEAEDEETSDAEEHGTDEESASEAADADVSVEEAVMAAMEDLDDGDGADRDALVARVTDRTGASADEVDDAIQDLLMSGQCYEPDDGLLKPI